MDSFDLIVIGAGPGGYVAAIRAAQLGLSVACVDAATTPEGKPAPGGTCTNVGCIPSKALLQSTEYFEHAQHNFAEHGISSSGITLDVVKMVARKRTVIKQNNEGILYLFKKNKVHFFHGTAAFVGQSDGRTQVVIKEHSQSSLNIYLSAQHVIIASGSSPRALPDTPFDEEIVLSNSGALAIEATPKQLAIIGAGVIGLEMGTVWRRAGAEVHILEAMPDFLAAADTAVAKEALKQFTQQGLQLNLGVKIGAIKTSKKGVEIAYLDASGAAQKLSADKLIVSIGRLPNTQNLDLTKVKVATDERGFIIVDDDCKTNTPNIWAVGDVVRGPMLAHKAEEEGVAVAERIVGQHGHVEFRTIPWVIYTHPEIAWVGATEQQLKEQGVAYRAGSFPFAANGRARAFGDTTGFVKILADATTDEVLGVHIIGHLASELIAEAVMAMAFHASSEDIARICHAHPTLSEATKEAALALDKRALNY